MPLQHFMSFLFLPMTLVAFAGCRPQAAPAPSRGPLIDCPEIVSAPPAFAGDHVEFQFTVSNPGDADLVVSQIQTSCSCLRVEVRQADVRKTVSGFTLAPGRSLEWLLTESVQQPPGKVQHASISFETNIPDQPQVFVHCVISHIRGLSLAPSVLVFEPQIEGQSKSVGARLINTSSEPITVLGVENQSDILIRRGDQSLVSIDPLETVAAVFVHTPSRAASGSRACQLRYRCDRDGAVRTLEFHLSSQVRPEYQLSRTTITLGADVTAKKDKQFEQEISRSDGGEFSLKLTKYPHCELELVPGPSKARYVLRGRVTPPKPGQPLQIPVQLTAVHAGVEKPVRFVVYSID